MTSSLVGSEMCIRDRPGQEKADGGCQRVWCRAQPRAEGGGPRGPAQPGGRRAVSYTHLTLPTICSV
eukprot:8777715-Prorocentrum_lima.AAC.1